MEWYTLMCGPNTEKSTKKNIWRELELNNLSGYVEDIHIPVKKENIKRGEKNYSRERVLIPGYILIKMDINTNGELLPIIKKTKGVFGWLNTNKITDRPEKMSDRDVSRFLDNEKDMLKESEKSSLMFGDKVLIKDGAFSSFVGIVEKMSKDNTMATVSVEVFGRTTPVEVEVGNLEQKV